MDKLSSSESIVIALIIAIVLFLFYLKFYAEKYRSDPVWRYPQEYPDKALLQSTSWGIPDRMQ